MLAPGADIDVAHQRATVVAYPAPCPTDSSPTLGVVVLPVAGPLGVFLLQLLCVAAVKGNAEGVGSGPSQGHGAVSGVIWEHGLLPVSTLEFCVEVLAHGFSWLVGLDEDGLSCGCLLGVYGGEVDVLSDDFI